MSEPCKKEGDVSALQQEIKAVWKRIDEQKQMAKAVYELVAEVRVMNVNLTHMNERQQDVTNLVEKIESRIDNMQEEQDVMFDNMKLLLEQSDTKLSGRIKILEDAPGKRLLSDKEAIRKQVITAIIAALITLAGGIIATIIAFGGLT